MKNRTKAKPVTAYVTVAKAEKIYDSTHGKPHANGA